MQFTVRFGPTKGCDCICINLAAPTDVKLTDIAGDQVTIAQMKLTQLATLLQDLYDRSVDHFETTGQGEVP